MLVTSSQKLSPRAGKVAANAMSRRKGNDLKLPSAASCSPLSRLTPTAPPHAEAPFGALYKLPYKTNNGDGFPSPQFHNLSRSPAVRRISHCASNISLRIRAISPCLSRISPRAEARSSTFFCYSRGSGCGTRAAVQWAVLAWVLLRAAHRAHMGGARTAPRLRPAG